MEDEAPEVSDTGLSVPAEIHSEKLRRFVDEWGVTLRDISNEVEDAGTSAWSWTVWDHTTDPLRLMPQPCDPSRAHELVHADNPAFANLAKVFSYMASQISKLKTEAQSRFYPLLLLFGERVMGVEVQEGETQTMLAGILPQLQ
eukprot:gene13297-15713_t